MLSAIVVCKSRVLKNENDLFAQGIRHIGICAQEVSGNDIVAVQIRIVDVEVVFGGVARRERHTEETLLSVE